MKMNTITKCFLYIAVMCPLLLANLFLTVQDIADNNSVLAILNSLAVIASCVGIRNAYKIAKGYEKILCEAISVLQAKSAIRGLADFFESMESETKGKEDEVATDK